MQKCLMSAKVVDVDHCGRESDGGLHYVEQADDVNEEVIRTDHILELEG